MMTYMERELLDAYRTDLAAARAELANALELLEKHQWACYKPNSAMAHWCPECYKDKPYHDSNCLITAALKKGVTKDAKPE